MSLAFRPRLRLEMMENRETPTTFPVDPSMPPENPPATSRRADPAAAVPDGIPAAAVPHARTGERTSDTIEEASDPSEASAFSRLSAGRYTTSSRGSAITPVRALAATVSGLARNTCASLWPMRPGKLRFVVLMHVIGVFSRPNVSDGPPRHAAHDWRRRSSPRRSGRSPAATAPPIVSVSSPRATSVVAGTTNVSIFTVLPLRMLGRGPEVGELAAGAGADVRPVELRAPALRATFALLSGQCGLATTGSIFVTSYTFSKTNFAPGVGCHRRVRLLAGLLRALT